MDRFNQKLPVLEAMIDAISKKNFLELDGVVFVCVQHLLYTTYDLLKALTRLGVLPENIHVMGKSYSSCPQVVDRIILDGYHYYPNSSQKELGTFAEHFKQDMERMWLTIYDDLQQKNVTSIVVLDDGVNCLINVPNFITEKYSLIGIEQTTSGLANPQICKLSFPVIEVATSATKQLVESPMIAEVVAKKLRNILPIDQKRLSCAVVGLGVIGVAITKKLLSLNHRVITYDKNPERNKSINGALRINNLDTLIYEADYIFGCSGEDITENLDINAITITKDKTFISCSSQDKEFLSLLKIIQQNNYACENILEHINYALYPDISIKIFRGGFPINLDNSGESVEALDIQLTRGLLLGGILQGISYVTKQEKIQENTHYMLHPDIQAFVVSNWLPYGSTHLFDSRLLHQFQDSNWIKEHSTGIFQEDDSLSRCFQLSSSLVHEPEIRKASMQ